MKLSLRLGTIANMVAPESIVVDVGCDHGYIPIWLVEGGIAEHAIACDINSEPLARARENIVSHDLENKIDLVLSNGIAEQEIFDILDRYQNKHKTLVIAGMGGMLISAILDDDRAKTEVFDTYILQPQSKEFELRSYLSDNGFMIKDEDIVYEDGKYYSVIKAVKGVQKLDKQEKMYGPVNIRKTEPVFLDYLNYRKKVLNSICCGIAKNNKNEDSDKLNALRNEMKIIEAITKND